jgi:hypothetical protein
MSKLETARTEYRCASIKLSKLQDVYLENQTEANWQTLLDYNEQVFKMLMIRMQRLERQEQAIELAEMLDAES